MLTQRYITPPSHPIVLNPKIFGGDAQNTNAVIVAQGVHVTWASNAIVTAWLIFRADASLATPQVLVAILPANARTWTDVKRQDARSYAQGHAHTYRVYATH